MFGPFGMCSLLAAGNQPHTSTNEHSLISEMGKNRLRDWGVHLPWSRGLAAQQSPGVAVSSAPALLSSVQAAPCSVDPPELTGEQRLWTLTDLSPKPNFVAIKA